MTNKQIVSKIKKAKKIAIFSHRDPDPDACGSMFGLREFCRKLGKEADVFVKKSRDKYLDYIFPLSETKEDFVASNYDLIVLVDIHVLSRIDKIFQPELFRAEANDQNFLVIDHHIVTDDEDFSFKNFRIEDVAACSQMITDLFKEENLIPSPEAATYIYGGIMGDTDRFLHSNLTKKVFDDASFLFEAGANVQHVYDYMYRFKTKANLSMNKFFLENLQYVEDGKVGYLIVSAKDRKKLGMDLEDVKFFSNEIVTISGVKLSFLCYEKDDGEYKISLRSIGDIYLVDFASKMAGGGHPNAAGFQVYNTTKKKIEKLVKSWAKEILNV